MCEACTNSRYYYWIMLHTFCPSRCLGVKSQLLVTVYRATRLPTILEVRPLRSHRRPEVQQEAKQADRQDGDPSQPTV